MATTMIAALSDLHAGSTVAVAPPEPFELDDGGEYVPSRLQRWLWSLWDECWGPFYSKMLDRYQPDRQLLVLNGDMVDGFHHKTPQIVSSLEGAHFRLAHDILSRGPLRHGFDELHVIRGTEAHVGRSGGLEEGLARALHRQHKLPVVFDPDTGTATSFWRRLDVDGVMIDLRHHGRAGQRTHTKDSYLRLYAHDIWESHVRAGDPPPDLAIRGHHHRFGDSGRIHDLPTRVVGLPCWQMLTAFGHRIAIEDLGHIGIVVFIVRDGKLLEPEPAIWTANRPTIVRSA